ncbi:MAG: hypothetical protein D6683_04100 [Actinomyces sp.]|nr:MAG: hypothetical protein D6683_04100 [Actinomyces sp.]
MSWWHLVHRGLGAFEVTVNGPVDVDPYDHVVIFDGPVPPDEVDDTMLASARFVGPVREVERSSTGSTVIRGSSMVAWLGDEDGKGSVPDTIDHQTGGMTFAQGVRWLLPMDGSIIEGTITSTPSGTGFPLRGVWDPRTAVTYFVDQFTDADWRVTLDGKLDAGLESELFVTTPRAVISPRVDSDDVGLIAGGGLLATTVDGRDMSTKVKLFGSRIDATGEFIVTTATPSSAPTVTHIHGTAADRVRIINESASVSGAASARAQLQANRFGHYKTGVTLSSVSHRLAGAADPGDYVYVFDPDIGLVDTTNEVPLDGSIITPVKTRLTAVRADVTPEATVMLRRGDGTWVDITPRVTGRSTRVEWTVGGPSGVTTAELPPGIPRDASITVTTPGTDTTIPNPPTLTPPFTTWTHRGSVGVDVAAVRVTWTLPTTNTDASPLADGAAVIVRWRKTGDTDWSTTTSPGWVTSVVVDGLDPASSVEFQAAALDAYGNVSAWTSTTTVTVAGDTVAPSTPSAPTMAAGVLNVQVSHDLTAAGGGNLETDLDHLEVHLGTTSGFTPSASTHVGNLDATAAAIGVGVGVVGTFPRVDTSAAWCKVVAVDRSGNKSGASAAASASATLIDTAHITDLAVTTAKIGDLAVTTAKIADLAVSNAKIADIAADKITTGAISTATLTISSAGLIRSANYVAGSAGWAVTATGAEFSDVTVRGTVDAATITGSTISGGTISSTTISSTTISGGTITGATVTGGTVRTASSGKRVEMSSATNGLRFYSSTGSERARVEVDTSGHLTVDNVGSTAGMSFTSEFVSFSAVSDVRVFPSASYGFHVVDSTSSIVSGRAIQTAHPFAVEFYRKDGSSSGNGICVWYSNWSTTKNLVCVNYITGSIANDTGVYASLSDRRLKTRIRDAGPQLDELRRLRVRKFKRTKGLADDGKGGVKIVRRGAAADTPDWIGFVADEVADVKPGLVDVDETGYAHVKVSLLIPVLVKAVQELADRVDALASRP